MKDSPSTRRSFLTAAGVAAASWNAVAKDKPVKPSLNTKSSARVLGANDRVRVGMIGVGIMGTGHLRDLTKQANTDKDIEIAGIADVYQRHRDRAKAISGIDAKAILVDYRELLQRPDIDCVVIATPDHWHAQMAIDAFAAGKDVYLQKPITLTVDESAQVIAAAAHYHRVLQVGSQFLSDPRWHKARELISSGAIGEPLWAQTTYSRNSNAGEWNYYIDEEATPETIDWTRWIGPAKKRPFSPERFFRWRKYWEYSNGISSDLYYHRLGPILFAMGAQYPTRVSSAGGIYVQKDREVPDTSGVMVEYPNYMIMIAGSMANAAANRLLPEVIYGHEGTMVVEARRVVVTPEKMVTEYRKKDAQEQTFDFPQGANNNNRLHTDNFFSCMRTRKTPNLGPELAHQIMTAIGLGVESWRQGQMKLFDPATRKRTTKASARTGFEGDGKNHPQGPRKQPAV